MAGAETDPLTTRRPGFSIPIEVSALTVILALALALLAGAGAALYQRTRPASYLSVVVLYIDQPLAVASAPDSGELLKLQELRYQYGSLVRTDVIGRPVARQTKLPASVVESDLAALIDPASFTIDIVATTKSPSQSGVLAQDGATALINYVARTQLHLGIPAVNRVVLNETTTPHAGVAVTASTKKQLVSGAIAFIVVGAAFLVVADLLRRRW
jgi:hypothetical protein